MTSTRSSGGDLDRDARLLLDEGPETEPLVGRARGRAHGRWVRGLERRLDPFAQSPVVAPSHVLRVYPVAGPIGTRFRYVRASPSKYRFAISTRTR